MDPKGTQDSHPIASHPSESQVARSLKMLGYAYSGCVFSAALILAFLYHTGRLDNVVAKQTSKNTTVKSDENDNHKNRSTASEIERMEKPKLFTFPIGN